MAFVLSVVTGGLVFKAARRRVQTRPATTTQVLATVGALTILHANGGTDTLLRRLFRGA